MIQWHSHSVIVNEGQEITFLAIINTTIPLRSDMMKLKSKETNTDAVLKQLLSFYSNDSDTKQKEPET